MNFATKQMILHSGRSWWQARYSDGKVLSEWDTLVNMLLLPLGKSNSSRWEEVPKEHMIGLRLLCPNGMCGELEAKEGSKFFQLKNGGINILSAGMVGASRYQNSHLIGVVIDANGTCICRAWETVIEVDERGATTDTVPPGSNTLIDNKKHWKHNELLGKTIEAFGQKHIIWGGENQHIKIFGKWEDGVPNNREYTVSSMHRRLLEFQDNVFEMRYQNIGRLNLDVQQLKIGA